MAALLGFGLGTQFGNFNGTTIVVDGNEGQIARIGVSATTGHEIFRFDANAHFH